jgi:hypothetical protein
MTLTRLNRIQRHVQHHREQRADAARQWMKVALVLCVGAAVLSALAGLLAGVADVSGVARFVVVVTSVLSAALSTAAIVSRAPEHAARAESDVAQLVSLDMHVELIRDLLDEPSDMPDDIERRLVALLHWLDTLSGASTPPALLEPLRPYDLDGLAQNSRHVGIAHVDQPSPSPR